MIILGAPYLNVYLPILNIEYNVWQTWHILTSDLAASMLETDVGGKMMINLRFWWPIDYIKKSPTFVIRSPRPQNFHHHKPKGFSWLDKDLILHLLRIWYQNTCLGTKYVSLSRYFLNQGLALSHLILNWTSESRNYSDID